MCHSSSTFCCEGLHDASAAAPQSREEIRAIQRKRKRIAFVRAKQIPWYRGKLDHIDADRLDDPAEWSKIPILDKESLRQLNHDEFLRQFCCAPPTEICSSNWRSGGTTGTPVFYPRTHEDIRYGLLAWWTLVSLHGHWRWRPLRHRGSRSASIRPARFGAQSALFNVGMAWAGAGNRRPSEVQPPVVETLKPTVFMGMSSFALHLGDLAAATGIDSRLPVRKVGAPGRDPVRRQEREDRPHVGRRGRRRVRGMKLKPSLDGARKNAGHDGIHVWTDMYYVEAVDPVHRPPVPGGEDQYAVP